ncbi:MAG: DoxX family membrane protein [Cocleimonas sp.]
MNTAQIGATNIASRYDQVALMLRVGLGLVFVIGGTSKLSLLLGSSTHDAMVANYMGTSGYINTIFQQFLFPGGTDGFFNPSVFLTALSTFELFSGIALIAGFLVRPLSIFYAFLMWTFVVSLPVLTVPGVEITVQTYTSPALFVQIRDVALSGMFFVLFNLGSGIKSIDNRFFSQPKTINWNVLGLLLRFALAMVFIIAGFFGGFAKIATFTTWQPLLAVIGLLLIFGNDKVVRGAGLAVVAVMIWYMTQKLNMDKDIIGNLNGIKREFALGACGGALLMLGGGLWFTLPDLIERTKCYIAQFRGTDNAIA